MILTILADIYLKYIIQSIYWVMVIFGFAIVASFLLFLIIITIWGSAIVVYDFINWATNTKE